MSRVIFIQPAEGKYEEKGGRNRKVFPAWSFRIPQKPSLLTPARFMKHLGAKVSKAIRSVSCSNRKRSSRKISSASFARSRSYAETLLADSQRAEAIEDCIEFLNSSSSSLPRSSSVSCSF
ncbi:unnamed protein product [Cuscuta europaea]|uniref:Josephin-like protein n=1 Tax=Cuscuta europaea TaxID=41803 RepID=A0A9P0ZK87_CUSEU|nr:unnamed protein product [Cuscuta europaea]